MVFLSNWQRNLKPSGFSILIILFIFIFIFYEFILLSRLSAERYLDKALGYLEKSRSLNKDIIIEKSLLYYRGLKLFKNSLRLNPFDSRFYFEYAEAIAEIGGDPQLSNSLDIDRLDEGRTGGVEEFYELAKTNYIEAILREPTNAIYHHRLGKIYDKLSDSTKAEEEFRKAASLSPQNAGIHLYLSQYFLSKNKEADFLYHIKKAVELQRLPDGSVVGDVFWFLKSIGREDLMKK